PANNPMRNSHVILRHADGRFSFYFHVRQGSARVTAGQQVDAGTQLADVGNAGFSTEPHLHFEQVEIGASGRLHALPSSFVGLQHLNGTAVNGVPKGSIEYVSP